ncbi:MAG: hypothetical protein COC06_12420 [Bacteroidales bacterium]|nr:MAG: hypothetical protein COC06_12420 [Bacteroidales bacterium]
MKKTISFLIVLAAAQLVYSQNTMSDTMSSDMIQNKMVKQLSLFPKEKVHLHIDRSVYMPGDTLWFKAYLVHSSFHIPLSLSRYVYVDLVNPFGELVKKIKIREDERMMFHGCIPIPGQIAAGDYTLRAYTKYMLFEEEQHLFRRDIRISLPGKEKFTELRSTSLPASKGNVIKLGSNLLIHSYYSVSFLL